MRHNIYGNLFPHNIHLVLSILLPSTEQPSLDLVRTQTKDTQAQGHSAVMLHPPCATGYRTHSRTRRHCVFSASTEKLFVFNSLVTHQLPHLLIVSLFPLRVHPASLSSQFPPPSHSSSSSPSATNMWLPTVAKLSCASGH